MLYSEMEKWDSSNVTYLKKKHTHTSYVICKKNKNLLIPLLLKKTLQTNKNKPLNANSSNKVLNSFLDLPLCSVLIAHYLVPPYR